MAADQASVDDELTGGEPHQECGHDPRAASGHGSMILQALADCSEPSVSRNMQSSSRTLRAALRNGKRNAARARNNGGQMTTGKRGFASMDRNRQREIASKGGKLAHLRGMAHEWTSEEAREAGRKGGAAVRQRKPAPEPQRQDQQ